ncbi:MAG: tetratricopeptide repeat protein [Deltaproteobacteria bacterium]|nr:tetratricopeptide repeat protein [Deltaproteobacteria bacterium]
MKKIIILTIPIIFLNTTCTREPKIVGSLPTVQREMTLEEQAHQYSTLAYDRYKEANYVQAVQLLENALLFGGSLDYHHLSLLGQSLLKTGKYIEAQKIADELISLYPESSRGYEIRGFSHLARGDFEKAENDYLSALDLNDHSPMSYFYIGTIYDAQDKARERESYFKEAEDELLVILKNNPNDFSTRFELIYLYVYWNKKLDQTAIHIDFLKKWMANSDLPDEKQNWEDFYLLGLEGMYLCLTQKFQEAILKMSQALASEPTGSQIDVAEVYYYIGKSFEGLHQNKKAQEFYDKALQTDSLKLYSRHIASLPKSE